jgi:hypothetical protein
MMLGRYGKGKEEGGGGGETFGGERLGEGEREERLGERRCRLFFGRGGGDLSSSIGIENLTFMLNGMCCARVTRPTTPVKRSNKLTQQQNRGHPHNTPETCLVTAVV